MLKLVPLLGLLLTNLASAAGEFYCCQEPASGRRICGDVVPEACRGRGYRVLDRGGNLLKEVGPPLSPEQRAIEAEMERQRKQAEAQLREQRRRDQALLDTYATLEDIDIAQRKAEADVAILMRSTQDIIEKARKRRQKLDNEAEFYKKRPMPPELVRDLRTNEQEIATQQDILAGKQRELDAVKSRYEAERKRYLELRGVARTR